MKGDLRIGAVAYDTGVQRVGVVMDAYESTYWLRPLHGGCEWEAPKEDVRPATVTDQLSAELAEVNAESRQRAGVPWG
ncbi:hypothetical protein [Streptomyces sp. CAU 1734]|uniref:hypothetical protein n=1 Tax=Streptomyces sp. CAU 1734 TaxID=3140360 RepID=UPI003261A311